MTQLFYGSYFDRLFFLSLSSSGYSREYICWLQSNDGSCERPVSLFSSSPSFSSLSFFFYTLSVSQLDLYLAAVSRLELSWVELSWVELKSPPLDPPPHTRFPAANCWGERESPLTLVLTCIWREVFFSFFFFHLYICTCVHVHACMRINFSFFLARSFSPSSEHLETSAHHLLVIWGLKSRALELTGPGKSISFDPTVRWVVHHAWEINKPLKPVSLVAVAVEVTSVEMIPSSSHVLVIVFQANKPMTLSHRPSEHTFQVSPFAGQLKLMKL